MTSPFTCISCRVGFRDLEVQRQHYKSDWHRYNLKRKVAELPPVTVEEFQKRVIAQRTKNDEQEAKESISCNICRKTFSTTNQYDNHTVSKKHKEKLAKQNVMEESSSSDSSLGLSHDSGHISVATDLTSTRSVVEPQLTTGTSKKSDDDTEQDSDVELATQTDEWVDDIDNPAVNNNCLFCNHHSKSMTRNLKHMTLAHSFFIPDPEYCIDMKGLLIYLGEKIFEGYMCIWCNDTGRAFQSADAARAHMIDKGHCKMLHEGEALAEYADFFDYSSSYPDAENGDPDGEVEIPELDDSDYQLVLPSGNVIGHRSLMRYYKQSLNPNKTVAISKSEKLRKVLLQYRALGWTGTQKEVAVKKARDIKYMQRVQAKYSTQLQFKANKMQRYFRPQVNF